MAGGKEEEDEIMLERSRRKLWENLTGSSKKGEGGH